MFLLSSLEFNTEYYLEGAAYNTTSFVKETGGLLDFVSQGGDPELLVDGRYLIKYPIDKGRVRVAVDRTGAELVFLYQSERFWCIASSFLLLCEYVRRNNGLLTLNKKAFSNFFIQTSLYEQPISSELVFDEIKLVDQGLVVEASEGSVVLLRRDDKELDSYRKFSFSNKMDYFISYYKGVLNSIASKNNINLELSGGVDSRVLFSLFKSSVVSGDIRISTDKNRKEDYAVVNILASLYDFKLDENEARNVGSTEIKKKYQLFKYSSIGVSRTNKRPGSHSGIESSDFVRINGGGGEASKSFYNINCEVYENVINKSGLSKDYKILKVDELRAVLEFHGYSQDPVSAMVEIYTKNRNRYFSGRAWYYSLLGLIISPFNSFYYQEMIDDCGLSDFFMIPREEIFKRNIIQLYMLLLSDPSLAYVAFDKKDKAFELSDILNLMPIVHRAVSDYSFDIKVYSGAVSVFNEEYLDDKVSGSSYKEMANSEIALGIDKVLALNVLDVDFASDLVERFNAQEITLAEELSLLNAVCIVNLTTAN